MVICRPVAITITAVLIVIVMFNNHFYSIIVSYWHNYFFKLANLSRDKSDLFVL